jgi:hypothetical protein
LRIIDVLDFLAYLPFRVVRRWLHKEAAATDESVAVYVSLTTIPSRIGKVARSIESLMAQTHKPVRIFLCVPETYRRFGPAPSIPEELHRFGETLQIVRCADDYGPGTKLLGALDLVPRGPATLLVLADDDVRYGDYMLEAFVAAFRRHPERSHSFRASTYRGVVVGEGHDGFALPTSRLDGVREFFESVRDDPHVFLVDDLWISFFMRMKGAPATPVRDYLRRPASVYWGSNTSNELHHIRGAFSRRRCMARAREVLRQRFGD